MSFLVAGKWHSEDEYGNKRVTLGEFKRQASKFRDWVYADKAQADACGSKFFAEANRYHLFVSLACPWAHRTLIFRAIKHLENVITITIVDPKMLEHGWVFNDEISHNNPVENTRYLYEIYTRANADYSGKVTVPVLWDKKYQTIVNNESAEVIRILNSSFNNFTEVNDDYYPKNLQQAIDDVNERVYNTVNNGVYRAGFATTQAAYNRAFDALFETMDWLEARLSKQRYLVGDQITEADWRLFTTLIRFDAVYYNHFKTNKKRLIDYDHLSNYIRELFQYPKVADSVNFDHIKTHYYYSHTRINPTQIIPKGPVLNFTQPHNRALLFQRKKDR
ncbi:MAG: glutathione S-transferase family protein [Pseudomonadota bacterium]